MKMHVKYAGVFSAQILWGITSPHISTSQPESTRPPDTAAARTYSGLEKGNRCIHIVCPDKVEQAFRLFQAVDKVFGDGFTGKRLDIGWWTFGVRWLDSAFKLNNFHLKEASRETSLSLQTERP